MNLMEYRAMKAQEEQEQQQSDSQGEQSNVQTQQTSVNSDEPVVSTQTQPSQTPTAFEQQGDVQTKPNTNQQTELQVPQYIDIDGQQISIDELKNGYLRQSDYTRKTQELANAKRQLQQAERLYQEFNKDPELAQQLSAQFGLPYVDPNQQAVMELQNRYEDLLLEREIENLQRKYQDFDTKGVLELAYQRQMPNLEDAYHLYKSYTQTQQAPQTIDVNSLKEQLRQEVLRELQSSVDTTSIIQSGGDTQMVRDNTPTLSEAELKIAQNLRMSPIEYAKWRDKR